MEGRRAIPQWDMSSMETQLEVVLHGVRPRPDFVSNLRTRLNQEPVPAHSRFQIIQVAVLSAAGLAGAIVLILAGIKAVAALLSVLGLLHQVSRGRGEATQHTTAS